MAKRRCKNGRRADGKCRKTACKNGRKKNGACRKTRRRR